MLHTAIASGVGCATRICGATMGHSSGPTRVGTLAAEGRDRSDAPDGRSAVLVGGDGDRLLEDRLRRRLAAAIEPGDALVFGKMLGIPLLSMWTPPDAIGVFTTASELSQ